MKKLLMLFSLVLFSIMLIGSASAFMISVTNYNPVNQKATISNFAPLGLRLPLVTQDIADVQLLTPVNNKVPLGYNMVAEFKVTGYTDYNNFISSLEMYDIKNNMASDNRAYDFKVLTNESYIVNDYGEKCYTNLNQTSYCLQEVIGNHLEYKEVWEPLSSLDFGNGDTLNIGIFTEVKNADYVEWIPTFAGVKLHEWAMTKSLPIYFCAFFEVDLDI